MLVAAGLEADRVTFNTLLKVCMRGNLPDKALHTFHQMQQLKIPVSSLRLELLAMPGSNSVTSSFASSQSARTHQLLWQEGSDFTIM